MCDGTWRAAGGGWRGNRVCDLARLTGGSRRHASADRSVGGDAARVPAARHALGDRFLAVGLACCFLGTVQVLAQPSAAAPIDWPEKLYNPAPAPQDLILPLPCGGAMAFRPVEIPGSGWLDDRPVELGQSDAERGYKEGRRLSHLAGAFTDPDGAARRYYIGKYEVTRDQYAAVMGPDCPKPSMRGRLPMTETSWFDAVELSRRATEWLLAHAADALPREDKEPGFLRLPTEEEWEFAARGGLAVDAADFLAPRFPMPEGDLARYAWYESSGSAEGQLHPVGLLKPNPLGLYDILGNAAELALSPFHLDRRGRPHGQSGGFVSRGGDIFTPEAQLGTAVRQEHNYFDPGTGKAKVLDSLGFRLVVTAPVIVSPQRLDAIKESWSELPALSGDAGTDAATALKQLKELAVQTQDEALRTRLELIQRDMERSQSAVNEARARTLRALIRTGAFMGKRVVTDGKKAEALERLMAMGQASFERFCADAKSKPGGQAACDEARKTLESKQVKWQAELERTRADLQNSLSYYGEATIGVGQDYTGPESSAALAVVAEELKLKQNAYLIPYAKRYVGHMADYRDRGAADKARWLKDLSTLEPERNGNAAAR